MILTIDRLGHLGDGIGQGTEGPVFVPGVLPGEVVEGAVEGDRVAAPRIVTPSPQRVRAPCRHARTCGGCALQHASDSFVAEWKLSVVNRALHAQGVAATFLPIITSPASSRRRATLAARRGKTGATLGFFARGSDQIVTAPGCILLHPDLVASFPALTTLAELGASRRDTLALTVTRSLTGHDVAVRGGKAPEAGRSMDMAAIATANGFARLTWNGETIAQRTAPLIALGRARVALPPGAFLQATETGQAALQEAVATAVGPARRIVDLFAGLGTFALPLAEAAPVHAVEGDAAMTQALEAGFRQASGLKAVTVEARDLFRRPLEPTELSRFDAAVIDPPRAGAEAQFKCLAQARVPVIAAVSCNPVTFARDARVLINAGYRLDWVQVIDQFRWSPHVELAARFSLQHIA